MRPTSETSDVPIEARLRNARRLITTIPPIVLLVVAAIAVSVGFPPRLSEVAGTRPAGAPAVVSASRMEARSEPSKAPAPPRGSAEKRD